MDAIAIQPPRARLGARLRMRLFASPGATIVTLLLVALLGWAAWALVEWGLLHAVAAPDYAACKALERQGACWGFVAEKWRLIVFGRVLRSRRGNCVCTIDKYEFRTQSRTLLPASTVRSDGALRRWSDGLRKEHSKTSSAPA